MSELPLIEMVLAIGALGTAAFGIVDGCKWFRRVASTGFGQIEKSLGSNVMGSLVNAYGKQYKELIQGQYINGRSKGDLVRTLRQGVRIGLSPTNAAEMAGDIGIMEGSKLRAIAAKVENGDKLEAGEQNLLGRFELAVDARIDAALALAENRYRSSMRVAAFIVAVFLALLATYFMVPPETEHRWTLALIVGLTATPLAPIAKDVATALQSVAKAIGSRQ